VFYSHIVDDALETKVIGGLSQVVFEATAATLAKDGKGLTRQYLSQRRKS
jgi:hypothetical protein